jgi:hypothetical protein
MPRRKTTNTTAHSTATPRHATPRHATPRHEPIPQHRAPQADLPTAPTVEVGLGPQYDLADFNGQDQHPDHDPVFPE